MLFAMMRPPPGCTLTDTLCPYLARFRCGIGQRAADDEGNGCFGGRRLSPSDRTQPGLGFRRAYGDEAPILRVERCRRGGADSHQLADLVVTQGGSRVVVLGGAATQDSFDDGVDHSDYVGNSGSTGEWIG